MNVERHRVLKDQVALIIGGAGAIGSAIAHRLCAADVRVAVADQEKRTSSAELGNENAMLFLEGDATNPGDVSRFFNAVISEFGRLDILVNSAGVSHVADIADVSLEDWKRVFAVNVDAPFIAMQEAIRRMREQEPHPGTQCRGKIINISSSGAEAPLTRSVAYGASKSALNYATRTVASACADDAVAATVIYPGNVDSSLWQGIASDVSAMRGAPYSAFVRERLEGTPTGMFQDPADLAEIVLFVASRKGLALTGKIVWTEAHMS